MNQILKAFYDNKAMNETVKMFFIEILQTIAIERAFKGESVVGIKEANEMITKAFDTMTELYGKIDKKPQGNSR